MKILLLDIENSPNLAYVWGKWEQDVIEYDKEWELLSFSYQWLGQGPVVCKARPHYRDVTDTALVKDLWKVLNEADIVVAHNGDKFDVRKARAKFLEKGLRPPSPFRTVDTLKVARKHFALNSNSLDDLARTLRVGRKMETGGFKLWLGCMRGDRKSWKKMISYNKKDIVLLRKVYFALRPWIGESHPLVGNRAACPACGSGVSHRRGVHIVRKIVRYRFCCMDCGSWYSGAVVKP